jgi:hypothetical protein
MRDSLISAIEAIVPTLMAGSKWRYTESSEGSVELRRFSLDMMPPELEEVEGESLFAGGNSYRTELQVNVAYVDIRDDDIPALVHADAIDLRDKLDLSTDPVIAGLFYAMPGPFAHESDEDGALVGYFPITLRILAPDGA